METKNLKDDVIKTGRPVKTGTCSVCNTRKSVFVKMDFESAAAPKPKKAAAAKAKKPVPKKTKSKKSKK